MRTISYEQIITNNDCDKSLDIFLNQYPEAPKMPNRQYQLSELTNSSLRDLMWYIWVIDPENAKHIFVKIAIFSTKLLLPIWKDKYPNDNRPEKVIEAAEELLNNPSNTIGVIDAVAYAAWADSKIAASDIKQKIRDYLLSL